MIGIKNEIEKYFMQNNQFTKAEDLKIKLKIKGEEQTDFFYSALNELVEEGSLFFDAKKGYRLFTNDLGYAFGQIEINKTGDGFLNTFDGHKIFIPFESINGALDGDTVIVSSIEYGNRENFVGKVNKIIKRKSGKVIFRVIGSGSEASLVPYNKNENMPLNINKNQLRNLVDGEIVLVKVSEKKEFDEYYADIIKTIGHKDDPNVDLEVIYSKYGVPVEFSKKAEREVEQLPTEVTEEEIKTRVDLRDKPIITIDCDGTKDRDDSVYVEKLENGNIKLYTSISHVSHYIKRGSKLFDEVLLRRTSHYPNNTCNPMFPHKLSNGICSLNPNVDRLTRTCELEITPEGKVVNYDIYKSVIRSRKAMKYSEVNRVLNGENIEGYENFVEQLNLLKELSDILEKSRENRNCIDFGIHDIELNQDENGQINGFIARGDGCAERIIENCMLITGTTVAEHFFWFPFIYRVHEAPNPETVKEVIKLLRLSGIAVPKFNNIDEKVINSILANIKNSEIGKVVRIVLLKSMKRARYDVNNIGHFALQLKKYCHFTSPIRRVADFMIHTIIDELDTFEFTEEKINELEKELASISEAASETERVAKQIEAEALSMAMAEYMEGHIGEEFEAMVTEVYQHGMFVETNNIISGKLKFEDMLDDYYYFSADKNAIIGKNTKKKYQIGNKLFVIVKDACKETRTINFEIGKQKSLRK